jgi:hypothetical protein
VTMADLTRATMVIRLPAGAYMTKCKACKPRWWRLRNRVKATDFDHPAIKFGTKPEANSYLREHEKTAYHAMCVTFAADTTPSVEHERLSEIFGLDLDEPCPKCGGHHKNWVDCDLLPEKR